ncbi:hypothetical protein BD410DRAFT_696303, partial [Rickenella mellea]
IRIVGHPDFRPEDVASTNWKRINAQLVSDTGLVTNGYSNGQGEHNPDGWTETPIKIQVPFHSNTTIPGPVEYVAGNLRHRKLMSVIREKILSPTAFPHFHLEPYEVYWQPDEASDPIRVHGELYSSETFIEAHRALQDSPGEPGCDLPRVVVGLMLASDATHLADFSDAKLWPVYLAFGNESKDRRGKPSEHAFEHIAYFEKLPDSFKSFAEKHFGGKGPNAPFMAHCNREIFHAQWDILLDAEFLQAYEHGIVIECCDGVRRRFYPRIFTYSADYPEKVVIALIRNLGGCPCPRCLIPLKEVGQVGTPKDMELRQTRKRCDTHASRFDVKRAREIVYNLKYTVNGDAVDKILKPESLVPTINAFSEKLSPFGFDRFRMLVVDLMHEVELGVWKTTLTHLLRILDCQNENLKYELDRRYHEIPPFGVDGIRKISSNTSELKRKAAHDYEDLLQCAIPVFDGLLPEPHNSCVLRLLFDLAYWHGLAKLRLQTDRTLEILSEATMSIGDSYRRFEQETCAAFETRELKREHAARQRREAKQAAVYGVAPKSDSRKRKQFNMCTYTMHALGDYMETIRRFGTTDSYTTQRPELEHRTSKTRYTRTGGKSVPLQLSRIEQRERRIRAIRQNISSTPSQVDPDIPDDNPARQYNMGLTENFPIHMPTFLHKNGDDPAVKDFFPRLRRHLLPRIQETLCQEIGGPGVSQGTAVQAAASNDSVGLVFFKDDCIYLHKKTRFHYTTYDVRRGTDILNPGNSRCDVMFLVQHPAEDPPDHGSISVHYYSYARVLGAYHANVVYTGPGMLDYNARRFDFLWVRWFEVPKENPPGMLQSVQFVPMADDAAFGFVDPRDVLRACHIIPKFSSGKVDPRGMGLSRCAKDKDDYKSYYIGWFSDRDLLMRYHYGLGVGHM